MPQLDTIYIFMTFMWTWLIMFMLTQKTKTFLITKTPKNMTNDKLKKPTLNLPWT